MIPEIPPGVVVIDANAIWQLEDPRVSDAVVASCRSADLEIHPTAVNIFEIVRIGNLARRDRLLGALSRISEGRNVLPLPLEFLKWIGGMISRREAFLQYPPSGHERALYDPAAISPAYVEHAVKMLDGLQTEFDERHTLARRELRRWLRERGLGDPWGSSVAFLDGQWTTRAHLDSYIEKYWAQMGLPEPAPIDTVLTNEAWRLAFEGLGATVYERAIANQLVQPAHASDIDQLVYLAGNPKRVLVTDDKGLYRVATDVLRGRYPGARVITVGEFLAQAS